MLPAYVVHSIEGRARLRHPALGEVAVRAAAQSALFPVVLGGDRTGFRPELSRKGRPDHTLWPRAV